jgi:hypothetical protein
MPRKLLTPLCIPVVIALAACSSAQDDATGEANQTATTCISGRLQRPIAECIDSGRAPNECLAAKLAEQGPGASLCDVDKDGLGDDFEDALAQSYAIAFAFNESDGTKQTGLSESHYPDNVAHYIQGSTLVYRVDAKQSTRVDVDPNPTPETLGAASISSKEGVLRASSPKKGEGTNFWLCLRQTDGKYAEDALVSSLDASRALKGGIDVVAVVHPTSPQGDHRYVFVAIVLPFAYNEFILDNHEGDWEGAGVIVDTETGAVVAGYFDRHPTVDNEHLVPLVGPNAAKSEDFHKATNVGNVCDEDATAKALGVRFWDYDGLRHHAVSYVGSGSHANYPYPGNTKILGVPGCRNELIVRDTHNGNGAVFLPWLSGYAPPGSTKASLGVTDGVHIVNAGEENTPRAAWASYRGQWGCQDAALTDGVARAYPAPWDNERHCRRWISHEWGSAPPFQTAHPSADCSAAP